MPIEHEAKVLDIDPAEMRERILSKGGHPHVFMAERLMRRYVYDIDPSDPSRWVRLRDDGGDITLTTKHVRHDGIDGTDEHEVTVSDFETTNDLLNTMGFVAKAYQESRRRSFVLDGAHVELDRWPDVPAFMEIEAESKAEVVRIAKLLGFNKSDLFTEGYYALYTRYGIDLAAITDLRF